jgi:MoxR-like ATPase
LATQNPIEQEGTYPLPEAQLDRFMFAINLEYPSFEEEVSVVKQTTSTHSTSLEFVFDATAVLEFQSLIRRTPVADNVIEYAVRMISKTRPNTATASEKIQEFVSWGAGPRASQNLILAAKTHAVLHGKFSADIEDVQAVSKSVLRHRIIKNYKAEAEGVTVDTIIESLY